MPISYFTVRSDRANLRGLGRRGDLLGPLLQFVHDGAHRAIDAALEVHRVHPRGDRLGSLAHDGLSENGRSGGAVTGNIAGLGRDLTHHLCAHVLELVPQFDFLGDGDAVLRDAGCAEALVEHHVAALGTKRDLHCVGQNVNAVQHPLARVTAEAYIFSSHMSVSSSIAFWRFARRRRRSGGFALRGGLALDDAHDVRLLHDHEFFTIEFHLGAGPFAE